MPDIQSKIIRRKTKLVMGRKISPLKATRTVRWSEKDNKTAIITVLYVEKLSRNRESKK